MVPGSLCDKIIQRMYNIEYFEKYISTTDLNLQRLLNKRSKFDQSKIMYYYNYKSVTTTEEITSSAGQRSVTKSTATSKRKVSHRLKKEIFVLYRYYKPLKILDKGDHDAVCEAVDTRNGDRVAIKKIKGVFDDTVDARRILREIKLLMHFDHQDVKCSYNFIIRTYLNFLVVLVIYFQIITDNKSH